MKKFLNLFILLSILTACQKIANHNHRFIEGQPLSDKKLSRIQVGQHKDKVLALLGSPIYRNTFIQNRWHYISHVKNHLGEKNQIFIIEFNSKDRVSQIIKP